MNRRDLLATAAICLGAEATGKALGALVPELDEYETWMVWAMTGPCGDLEAHVGQEVNERVARLVGHGYLTKITPKEWLATEDDDHYWCWYARDVPVFFVKTSAKGRATLDRMGFESQRTDG